MISEYLVVRNQLPTSDVESLRRFAPQELRAMGLSSIADMIRCLGEQLKGPDGSPLVYSINGRRPWKPTRSVPFLSPASSRSNCLRRKPAPRLGYSPSQPVLNFATKAKFQGYQAMASGQTSTEDADGTAHSSIGTTRLRGKSRLRQEDRRISPDPAIPFYIVGNVTGIGGAEIGPRLSELAETAVSIPAIPQVPDARGTLAAYLHGANRPNVTDLGPYRSLRPCQRKIKLSSFLSRPLSDNVTGMLSLSFERSRNWSLRGLSTASSFECT